MKANVTPYKLNSAQKDYIKQCAGQALENERVDMTRKFFKLLALALREPLSPKGYGMGAGRIQKVITKISAYASEAESNPTFWDEVDAALAKTGLDFGGCENG